MLEKDFFNSLFVLKNEKKKVVHIFCARSRKIQSFFLLFKDELKYGPFLIFLTFDYSTGTESICLDRTRFTLWHKKYSKYQPDKIYTSIYSLTLHQTLIFIFEEPQNWP